MKPDFWNGGDFEAGKDGLLECNDSDHPEDISKSVMKIVTNADQIKRLMCGAGTRGKKGDSFVFSSWLKAAAVPHGFVKLSAVFISPSGNTWNSLKINNDCDDWQYVSDVFIAPNDYTDIHIYIYMQKYLIKLIQYILMEYSYSKKNSEIVILMMIRVM